MLPSPVKKFVNGIKNFYYNFIEGDFFGLAAEISFYILSTFFPMIILIFTAASAISLNYTDAMFRVLAMLPDKAETLIVSMIASHTESTMVICITAFLSLTTMSGLILVAEKGLIRFYKCEDNRSFWKSEFIAIFFAILIFISIIASIGLIIFGRTIAMLITNYSQTPELALMLWNVSRYIVTFVFIAFTISALFKALPTVKLKLWEVIPGALFTTVAWYLASMIFAVYVNNFPQYEIIYGSLAGFACMIVWIYMIGIIILAGAKINAMLYHHKMAKRAKAENNKIIQEN